MPASQLSRLVLGKANFVAGIRSRPGLVSFAIVFSLGSIPWRTDGPGILGHVDYGRFSNSCSVVWLTSYSSRVDSAMRGSSISFLTRASIAWLDSCFGWFLCILGTMSRIQSDYRSIGNSAGSFRIVFVTSSLAQSGPICDM
jgi:hypothetical protein